VNKNQKSKYFARRIIFNHLEKTAGQSIYKLICDCVGKSAVTPNFSLNYDEAIARFGGKYRFIFGHILRLDEELDLRYEHVTILREPTDRIVSWLYYLTSHTSSDETHGMLIQDARKYLESDGDILGDTLRNTFNLYIQRFAGSHKMVDLNSADRINCAINSLEKYNLFGFYERLDEFTVLLNAFIPSVKEFSLENINTTPTRKKITEINSKLPSNIYLHNKDDYEFYDRALSVYEYGKSKFIKNRTSFEGDFYRGTRFKYVKDENVINFNYVSIDGVSFGNIFRTVVSFSLKNPIHKKIIGIMIHNQEGVNLYGINSRLLGIDLPSDSLEFSLAIEFECYFPCGNYYFGVALVDDGETGEARHLMWDDCVFKFKVKNPNSSPPFFSIPIKSKWSLLS
jgi:hypothetical protein